MTPITWHRSNSVLSITSPTPSATAPTRFCNAEPIGFRWDGCFIPLLLQSRVGMFGSVVELCWPGWPLVEHGARGHRQVGRGQARLLGVVRRAAGLRCPDSVMR